MFLATRLCYCSGRREETQSQAEGVESARRSFRSLQEVSGVALNKSGARQNQHPEGQETTPCSHGARTERQLYKQSLGGSPCDTSPKGCCLAQTPCQLLERMKTTPTTSRRVQAGHWSTASVPASAHCGVGRGAGCPQQEQAGAELLWLPVVPALPADIKPPLAGCEPVSDTSRQTEPRGHCPIIKETSEQV